MTEKAKRFLALFCMLALVLSLQPAMRLQNAEAAAKIAVKKVSLKAGGKNVTQKTYAMKAGETVQISAVTNPAAAAKAGMKYRSSDERVASVSKNGRISAKKAGAATITATVSAKGYQAKSAWMTVYVQAAQKPVLVFMHGGGLENSSALELKIYDGKYFADYTDVVFVSVNARLNYVGYLDLTDEMASALAAFCATGNPSTSSLKWEPYTVNAPRTMIFDRESSCKDSSFDDTLESIMAAEQ